MMIVLCEVPNYVKFDDFNIYFSIIPLIWSAIHCT